MNETLRRAFFDPLSQLGQLLAHIIPTLLIVLVILTFGAILASLVRHALHWILVHLKFDRLAGRTGMDNAVLRTGIFRSPSDFAARVVQGAIWVLIVLLALSATGTKFTEDLVSRFINYVPDMLAAALVLLLGSAISKFLARSALLAAVNAQWSGARLLAGGVRILVMSLAVVMALEQLRIGRTALLISFAILFGGVVMAAAIAFGFGARELARDWLQSKAHPSPSEGEDVLHHL
jgi:hypothetical protein